MSYNYDQAFDQVIDRRASDSAKWNYFDPDVLPMWVADMDFTAPPAGTAAEDLAALLARARALQGAATLDDDFSIMRLDL